MNKDLDEKQISPTIPNYSAVVYITPSIKNKNAHSITKDQLTAFLENCSSNLLKGNVHIVHLGGLFVDHFNLTRFLAGKDVDEKLSVRRAVDLEKLWHKENAAVLSEFKSVKVIYGSSLIESKEFAKVKERLIEISKSDPSYQLALNQYRDEFIKRNYFLPAMHLLLGSEKYSFYLNSFILNLMVIYILGANQNYSFCLFTFFSKSHKNVLEQTLKVYGVKVSMDTYPMYPWLVKIHPEKNLLDLKYYWNEKEKAVIQSKSTHLKKLIRERLFSRTEIICILQSLQNTEYYQQIFLCLKNLFSAIGAFKVSDLDISEKIIFFNNLAKSFRIGTETLFLENKSNAVGYKPIIGQWAKQLFKFLPAPRQQAAWFLNKYFKSYEAFVRLEFMAGSIFLLSNLSLPVRLGIICELITYYHISSRYGTSALHPKAPIIIVKMHKEIREKLNKAYFETNVESFRFKIFSSLKIISAARSRPADFDITISK